MARPINLYGRMVSLDLNHFRAQGYCRETAEHGVNMAESGQYSPERAIAWLAEHVKGCDQCRWANRIKISIVEFLQQQYPERYVEWQQGLLNDAHIAAAWVTHVRYSDPELLEWFLAHHHYFVIFEGAPMTQFLKGYLDIRKKGLIS